MLNQREVIEAAFQYLHLIESKGLNPEFFEEWLDFQRLNFRFQEKQDIADVASGLSWRYLLYPAKYLLGSPQQYHFNKTTAKFILENLVPSKIRILMDITQMTVDPLNLAERYYGIKYSEENLFNSSLIQDLLGKNLTTSNYTLPINGSEFLPTVFNLVGPQLEDGPVPRLVVNESRLKIWWKRDDVFAEPKIEFKIRLDIPPIFENELNFANFQLYMNLVSQAMQKIEYKTSSAGYEYTMSNNNPYGVSLSVSGYSQLFEKYLTVLVNTMYAVATNPVKDMMAFNRIKENLINEYANRNITSSARQSFNSGDLWMEEKYFQDKLLLEAASKITKDNYEQFGSSLFSNLLFAESLGFGNLQSMDSQHLTELILSKFKNFDLNRSFVPIQNPVFVLPCGSNYVYRAAQLNPGELNSASFHYFQMGLYTDNAIFARARLLISLLGAPVFNVLRAKEQLGYYVGNGGVRNGPLYSIYIIVQGTNPSEFVDTRIEVFLSNYYEELKNFSEYDLLVYKKSLQSSWLQKKLTLGEQAQDYWNLIMDQNYNFGRTAELIKEVDSITVKDISAFYYQNLISKRTRRRFAFDTEAKNLMDKDIGEGTIATLTERLSWTKISGKERVDTCVEDQKSSMSSLQSSSKIINSRLSSKMSDISDISASMKNSLHLTIVIFIFSFIIA